MFEIIGDSLIRKDWYQIKHDANCLIYNENKGDFVNIPHEYLFINYLKGEIRNSPNGKSLAYLFMLYCDQYYLMYRFLKGYDLFNPVATVLIECDNAIMNYQWKLKYDIEDERFDRIIKFGDIATDFLIRYKGYSLIQCMRQKIIITSQDNCHKKFENELLDGYTLHRCSKVYFKRLPLSNGYFYKLPVLPTRETYFQFNEIIETTEGSYQRLLR